MLQLARNCLENSHVSVWANILTIIRLDHWLHCKLVRSISRIVRKQRIRDSQAYKDS